VSSGIKQNSVTQYHKMELLSTINTGTTRYGFQSL